MTTQKRLIGLEKNERAQLLRAAADAEKLLLQHLTPDQQFASFVLLAMLDHETRDAPESERIAILRRRRNNASLQKLQADVSALQWALEQIKNYGKAAEKN